MKVLKILVVALAVVALIPATSYAIVDFGVYGGYSFANLDTGAVQQDMNGWEYGFLGHVNFGLPMLFSVGLGGFYQSTNSSIEVNGVDYDASKVMWGVDVMASLELPVFIHPFIRMGIAINEQFEVDTPSGTAITNERYFRSHYYAIGAGFSFLPFTRIYGEYVFNYSDQEDDTVIKSNAIHVGVQLRL